MHSELVETMYTMIYNFLEHTQVVIYADHEVENEFGRAGDALSHRFLETVNVFWDSQKAIMCAKG